MRRDLDLHIFGKWVQQNFQTDLMWDVKEREGKYGTKYFGLNSWEGSVALSSAGKGIWKIPRGCKCPVRYLIVESRGKSTG